MIDCISRDRNTEKLKKEMNDPHECLFKESNIKRARRLEKEALENEQIELHQLDLLLQDTKIGTLEEFVCQAAIHGTAPILSLLEKTLEKTSSLICLEVLEQLMSNLIGTFLCSNDKKTAEEKMWK